MPLVASPISVVICNKVLMTAGDFLFHICQMMPRLLGSAPNLTSPFEPLDFTARGDKVRLGKAIGVSNSFADVLASESSVDSVGTDEWQLIRLCVRSHRKARPPVLTCTRCWEFSGPVNLC